MFGIGLGEIALALLVVFLIAPKELPRVMHTIGRYAGTAERIRRQWCEVRQDVRDIAVSADDGGVIDADRVTERSAATGGSASPAAPASPAARMEAGDV
jgi:Sec-independent protein translocase protein TatA